MRSAELAEVGRIALTTAPVPDPAAGEVLVRMRAVGICGSDVHFYVDGRIGDTIASMPFVLGHEPAGQVAALGAGVTTHVVGQRVALEPSLPCGLCDICRMGRPNCCPTVRFLGSPPVAGVFEEYHIFTPQQCVSIPDNVSFEAAATLEPMAVGLHGVTLGRVRAGDRVAVLGCGPVGILTAMAARAVGATFIAMTDPIPARRAHAAQLVADLVLDPTDEATVPTIKIAAGQIDVVLEASGAQAAIDDASELICPGGTIVIIGIPSIDHIALRAHPLRRKEITLTLTHRSNFALEPCLRLMERGMIDPGQVITHRFPLEQLADGMELVKNYRDGVLKAMIVI